MKISTRLKFNSYLLIGALAIIGLIVFSLFLRIDAILERTMIANEFMLGVSELSLLTESYQVDPSKERIRKQWQTQHDSLAILLRMFAFGGSEQQAITSRMGVNLNDSKILFSSLAALSGSIRYDRDTEMRADLQKRLIAQLLASIRLLSSDAARLVALSNDELRVSFQKAGIGILVILGILGTVVTFTLSRLNRGFVAAVENLHHGTEIIGSGRLDYKVGTPADDEIGQLSRSFDRMTEQLKTVTVSRDKLQKEIEERKKVEEAVRESREQLQVIIDTIPSLISYVDRDFHYRWNNRAYREWFKCTAEEITGKHMQEVLGETVFQRILPRLQQALAGEGGEYDDYVAYPTGGRWVHGVYMPHRTAYGEVDGIVIFITDITERKRMEEEIKHMAHHDALTGLPNRRLFMEIVVLEAAEARRTHKKLAILFLDLDRFKEVNDTLGHEAGDELLVEVAKRLKTSIRESDTVARTGGDEFNIILTDIRRAEYVATVAQKIRNAFGEPYFIDGHTLYMTTSIGISIYPDDNEEIDTLFRYADIAMYHAKELGKNNYQFYNPDINIRSVEKIRFEGYLRQTIDRGELAVHYQPQVDIRTGRIVCAEALVRWQHPELGMLPSKRFIPAAEETGFVTAIDEWVLRTACAQFKRWYETGYPPVCVTVNLSAKEFQNPELVATIGRILRETGLSPDCLDIEITESMAMRNIEHTVKQLNELNAMGVRISVDDFGTGYSSLSYLKRLPIQRLKIDRSFIKDITTAPDDRAIVQAVTAMAHAMNMTVVAEGVETEEQLRFLHETQCDEAQGYLFNKPLPPERFTELIAAGK